LGLTISREYSLGLFALERKNPRYFSSGRQLIWRDPPELKKNSETIGNKGFQNFSFLRGCK
jgi:hypothetical protein